MDKLPTNDSPRRTSLMIWSSTSKSVCKAWLAELSSRRFVDDDPRTGEYKVVRYFIGRKFDRIRGCTFKSRAEVLTLGTDTWRRVARPTRGNGIDRSNSVHAQGFLYWALEPRSDSTGTGLTRLDFDTMPCPPCRGGRPEAGQTMGTRCFWKLQVAAGCTGTTRKPKRWNWVPHCWLCGKSGTDKKRVWLFRDADSPFSVRRHLLPCMENGDSCMGKILRTRKV